MADVDMRVLRGTAFACDMVIAQIEGGDVSRLAERYVELVEDDPTIVHEIVTAALVSICAVALKMHAPDDYHIFLAGVVNKIAEEVARATE